MAVAAPAPKPPQAPPVFRPQPAPKVLQPNTPSHKQQSPAVKTLAPAIYRPQPAPVVLQTKRSPTSGARLNSSAHVGRGVSLLAPGGVIQRYEAKTRQEKKAVSDYRKRYLTANLNDDEHYGPIFDDFVASAASMDDIKKFVEAAERKVKEREEKVSTLLTTGAEEEIKKPLTPMLSEEEKKEKKEQIKQKKKQKAKEKEKSYLDLSGPPPPLVNSSVSYVSKVGSGPVPPPISSPSTSLSSGPSKVQQCLGFLQKWDRKSDQGKLVTLTESEMENLVHGLDQILSKSGKSSKYFVGLSVGESKYNSHVCIKAIAGYGKEVGFKTGHKPTYHFEVTNQVEIPASLKSRQLAEKS